MLENIEFMMIYSTLSIFCDNTYKKCFKMVLKIKMGHIIGTVINGQCGIHRC